MKRIPTIENEPRLHIKDLPDLEKSDEDLPPVTIILHIYYLDIGMEILRALQSFPYRISQIVVTHSFVGNETLQIKECVPKELSARISFFYSDNVYRDSAPFIKVLKEVPFYGSCFLKLHTKKSPHLEKESGEFWRRDLVNSLIHFDALPKLLNTLASSREPIWACPSKWIATKKQWGSNNFEVWKLTSKLGLHFKPQIEFPVGNMYWFNRFFLESLSLVEVPREISNVQNKWTDGTWAHAIERLPGQISFNSGKFVEL